MSSAYTKVVFTNRQPDTITAIKLNQLTEDLSQAIAAGGGGGPPPTGAMTFGETPTGAINGSNTSYTTANAFAAGRLAVFLNGLRQRPGQDYNATSTTTFSFLNAPLAGDSVSVDYQS